MGRSFGARIVRDIQELFEPDDALHDSEPENEYVGGAAPHPTQGDPAHGIPVYPDPLPGGHDYAAKDVVTPQRVNVPPPQPYYAGGMAHGVASPAPHDGRIAPKGHDQHAIRGENEAVPKVGRFKIDPVPVYITEPGAGVHPLSRASFRQISIVPGNDPVPIVERNPGRERILLLNETQIPSAVSNSWEGSVTDPGANAGIVNTTTLPAGTYQITVSAYLSGTVAAGDANNMRVFYGATSSLILMPAVANAPVTVTLTVSLSSPGQVSVNANNAGSGAAVIYNAAITSILSLSAVTGVRLKNGPDSSVGSLLPSGMTNYRDIKSQDQIWAEADASATVTQVISIIEEYKQAR